MSAVFKIPARVTKLDTVDQVKWLKEYKSAIDLTIKTAQQRAVDEGLAEFVTVAVERAPNKAQFIAEFGEMIWNRMCNHTTRNDWRVIK